ncbi:MAG: leucine-rich repeat domain-containing protein [Bacteroidales bacterium]
MTLATQLEKIVVERDNKNFSANNGILYSSDFTTLLTYPLAKKDTEYEIPATVTEIASYVVFSENLTSITYKENKAPKATAGSPLFSKIDKTKCMLYVSKAAYESFKNTSPWNTLTNIIRYDATPEDLATKITLTSAGTLETQIGNKKFTTTHLILTGPLNGKDINCLREMAGSNANATVSGKGQLAYLDIKNTTIVQSDDIYLNQGIGNTGNSADKKEAQKTTNNLFPHYAFYKCPTLQTIILPTSVTAIGNSALRACDNLSKVDMTDCEFTSIDHNAFRSSKKIATFNLPVSLETIANDAFVETTVNKEFKLQSSSNWFEVQEGVLFSKDKKNLVAFPAGKNITEYTVPFGTERIVSCAFSFSALKTLSMPYGLIYLEPWAFEGTNFASLTLPATVTEIGRGVFLGCGSVEHLYIHNPTPPAVSDKEGQELDKINCILHVPYQKKDTYKKANYWSEFTKIEELSDVIYVYTAGTLKSTLRNMGIEPSELSSIMVHGFLNGNDIKYLRELAGVDSIGQPILNTKLKSINIGQATIQAGGDPYLTLNRTSYTTSENNLGKYAFANTGLEAFHFPANIAAVEANIFTACRDLNYIVFETLPGGMNINDVKSLLDESQPNGIIAINSNNPGNNSNIANVVFANDKNATVELTDKFNYVSHVKLSLESCTFTKHFSKATKDGETRGWETIILPFKPTEIRGYNRRGVEAFLVPFNENEKDEAEFDGQGLLVLNFWLRKLTPTGFVDVTFHEIEPNTPYIISMPNSPKDYNNTYNIQGDVQFIAYAPTESSIELNETTELKTIAGETFDMAATFKNRTDIKDAYVLNAEGTSFDLISTITQKQDTINAFEAYATAHPAYKGVRSLSINQRPNIPSGLRDIMMNGADGEEKEFIIKKAANGIRIVSNVNKAIQIHSIEGRLIAKEYIYEGENFVALPKGIYLIERQKVVVY